jgi:flavin-dependent dehydrogenase
MDNIAAQDESCDVLVVGGGPAGSTIAALLAERGHDVMLLEKSKHPRFHIGESLLPMNMPLFEQLGVADEIRQIGMVKLGAEFVSPWHGDPVMINFDEAWDNTCSLAYQVRRSDFDLILFRNAIKKGARAFEQHRVTAIEFQDSGATATVVDADRQTKRIRAKFLVDASGRDTFLSDHFGIKHKNKKHNSAAIFGHFEGATRLPGEVQGNISLFWFDHGWFWFIPLSDGATSVGATCWPYYMKTRKTDVTQFFMDTIAQCPALAERLKDARLVSPVTATGNFSYWSERSSGRNYIMLGDAFAFIDPVFSSGVFLAMNSAFAGADAVDACLKNPQQAARALKEFDRVMMQGPKIFSWFIYRITTPAMRYLFMYDRAMADPKRPAAKMRSALISVLIGDVYRKNTYGHWLFMFKLTYYIMSIANLKASIMAWRKRKRSIRIVEVGATD